MIFAATRQSFSLSSSISFVSEGVFGEIYCEMSGPYQANKPIETDSSYFTALTSLTPAQISGTKIVQFGDIYVFQSPNETINGKRAYLSTGQPVNATANSVTTSHMYRKGENAMFAKFTPTFGIPTWKPDVLNFNWKEVNTNSFAVQPIYFNFVVKNTGSAPIKFSLGSILPELYGANNSNLASYYATGIGATYTNGSGFTKIDATNALSQAFTQIKKDETLTVKVAVVIKDNSISCANVPVGFNVHLTSNKTELHTITLDSGSDNVKFPTDQRYYVISYAPDTASQTIELPALTWSGHTFAGYGLPSGYANPTGLTFSGTHGCTLTIPADTSGNITLVAKWT